MKATEAGAVTGDGDLRTAMPAGAGSGVIEALCLDNADLVKEMHAAFLDAGAQWIRTNSLRANAVFLERAGLAGRVNELNWTAAQIARAAAKGRDVVVAGRVGPVGLSPEGARARGIDLPGVYLEQIGALLDGGVQAIILEGFSDEAEMRVALEAKQTLHHCPAICVWKEVETGLAGAGGVKETLARLLDAGADIAGVTLAVRAAEEGGALWELSELPEQTAVVLDAVDREAVVAESLFTLIGKRLAERRASLILGGDGVTAEDVRILAGVLKAPRPGNDSS